MADNIDDAIHRIHSIVKNGKFKHKKIKLKTDVSKNVDKEVADILNDNVTRAERDKICKKARKGAHNYVADVKKKLSDEIRKDLGLD